MSDTPDRPEPERRDSGVVTADGDERACAECQPLPAAIARRPQAEKTPARWAYERLVLFIQAFEERLDADHEVGMGFAGSDAGTLHINGIGYFGPDIITFYGVDGRGQKTQLIQHVSQLNVMLKAAPKVHEKAERIGFELRTRLESGAEDGDDGTAAG